MYVILNFILLAITFYCFIKNFKYSPKKIKIFSSIILFMIVLKCLSVFYLIFSDIIIDSKWLNYTFVLDYIYSFFIVLINMHISMNNRKIEFNYIYIPFILFFSVIYLLIKNNYIHISLFTTEYFYLFSFVNNKAFFNFVMIILFFVLFVILVLFYSKTKTNKFSIMIVGLSIFIGIMEFIFCSMNFIIEYEPIIFEILLVSLFVFNVIRFENIKLSKERM